MERYEQFEDVVRLEEGQLGQLLSTGDSQERVWAGWTLALHAGQEARARLREAFHADPDPGVRRHHLVVLVGLGEHALVARAAARDSDAELRATATRYLARLAEPDHAGAYDLLVARTIDLAWIVRFEVADALRTDAPPSVVRAVAGLLFDPDPDVRAAMRRRLRRGDFDPAPFEEALAVLQRLDANGPDLTVVSAERALALYRPLRLV